MVKPYYLANVIANVPACKSTTDCQKIISNALNYHSNNSKQNNIDVGEVKPRGFPLENIYIIHNSLIKQFVKEDFETITDFDFQ